MMLRIVGSIRNPYATAAYVAVLADGREIAVSAARYWRIDRALDSREAAHAVQ